jgi:hypothetical protein
LRLHGLIDGKSVCRITPERRKCRNGAGRENLSAWNPDEQNLIAIIPLKD